MVHHIEGIPLFGVEVPKIGSNVGNSSYESTKNEHFGFRLKGPIDWAKM
jgi:hypothetical protein